ncbi:MAG: hypothetical protein ABEJ99_00020, partial [Candidatus Nanohaloarchaea archaeon]
IDTRSWAQLESDLEETRDVAGTDLLGQESSSAFYILHPAKHDKRTVINEEILDGIDGIVLEESKDRYESLTFDDIHRSSQYSELIDSNLENGKAPIFDVDIPYEGDFEEVLEELEKTVKKTVVPALSIYGGDLANTPLLGKAVPYAQLSNFFTPAGARSAITADKMEKMVAPKLSEDLGRKPNILVEYGSGHLDTKIYLKFPRIRENVISYHESKGFHQLDEDYLDSICEFRFQDFGTQGINEAQNGERYKKTIYRFN